MTSLTAVPHVKLLAKYYRLAGYTVCTARINVYMCVCMRVFICMQSVCMHVVCCVCGVLSGLSVVCVVCVSVCV